MKRTEIPIQLLSDVKNFLNITWNDDETEQKLCSLIASASVYLDGKAGRVNDYEEDGMPRTLLFEYVRYMRDEALDVFENNYTALILTMQNERLTSGSQGTEQKEQ
nr:MAG TPA: Head Tail Connector Protein [Bacteriophage sp.]